MLGVGTSIQDAIVEKMVNIVCIEEPMVRTCTTSLRHSIAISAH